MSIENIVTAIDAEINRLQQVRKLLASTGAKPAATTGTPSAVAKPATKKRKRSKMSAEARKRIAEAQRKRWAKQKAQKS